MAETKSEGQKLKDKLLVKRTNGWEALTETEKKKVLKFSDEYINFLNNVVLPNTLIRVFIRSNS